MPQPCTNIVDALSGEEVCPLCFDRFSEADASCCVVCRVSSCPSCAEVLDADGAVRCFACRPPAQVAARERAEAASAQPLSLPRPIAVPNAARSYTPGYGAASLPPLPFPLTTSPYGVRRLQPKPPGSVFVGLPALSQQLAHSLQGQVQRDKRAQPRLARRPQQKLMLLTRMLDAAQGLSVLGQRAFTVARSLELRARLVHTRAWLALALAAPRTWLQRLAESSARALLVRARLLLRAKSKRAVARASVLTTTVSVDPSRPIHL